MKKSMVLTVPGSEWFAEMDGYNVQFRLLEDPHPLRGDFDPGDQVAAWEQGDLTIVNVTVRITHNEGKGLVLATTRLYGLLYGHVNGTPFSPFADLHSDDILPELMDALGRARDYFRKVVERGWSDA